MARSTRCRLWQMAMNYELSHVGAPPFSLVWSNPQPGTYVITAKAFDNKGARTYSAPITITVYLGP